MVAKQIRQLMSWHAATRAPSSRQLSGGEVVEVQRRTGDEVFAERGIKQVRFLKVDTECMIDSSRIAVILFGHNYVSIFWRTVLRDFFAALTPPMRIGRVRDRTGYFDYAAAPYNFPQANALRFEPFLPMANSPSSRGDRLVDRMANSL